MPWVKAWGWRLWPQRFARPHLAATPSAEIEEAVVPLFLDRTTECIDVGANRGRYTVLMSLFSRHVHAFEPNPDCLAQLQRLGVPNASIYPCALSSSAGVSEYFVPVREGQRFSIWGTLERSAIATHSEVDTLRVSMATLDALGDRPISFVKIDVEGHEMEVLQGGRKLISAQQPIFMVEAEERHCPNAIQTVHAFFQDHNYQGFFIRDRDVMPLAAFDDQYQNPAELQRPVPRYQMRYVNNFIFLPPTVNPTSLREQMQAKLTETSCGHL